MIIIIGLVLVISRSGGCTPVWGFDSLLSSIVKPYRFSIASWELKTLLDRSSQSSSEEAVEDEPSQVTKYFSLVERINALKSEIKAIDSGDRSGDSTSLKTELSVLEGQRANLEDAVRRIITNQIREVLAEQGIFNPVDRYIKLKIGFPPVSFRLEPPPHLLVVSPRDRIESIREITLRQNLSLEEMEDIEDRVDKLGVSSLVVKLGGFGGTYPAFVVNDASLRFTLDTATEEWLHQYLVFKPLGFLYLLDLIGVSRNYDIATMNETVASMVSKEIGAMVYEKYYSQYEGGDNQLQEGEPEFDFNREMREIRQAVDTYLAQGKIELAEKFMEEKRQFLASKGYYIRKLNQAYFAFHGTYADKPTSISPIGQELKQLRSQSASLKDFLDTVAGMTSRQDLINSIK
ncbi:MAG: hypothetical protein DRI01_08555 [Chloroflexi bacterium]|nr:MAG: hypothetical protein DRI01_08555 [Chloroflexota bacterium]